MSKNTRSLAPLIFSLLTISSMILLSASASAALVSRLGGLAYYDTEADLTWLTDANHALTSGYDDDGRMNWYEANTWADGLIVGGNSNWRLATIEGGCIQFNCDDSDNELGNMFYNVLGNAADPDFVLETNTGPFDNVQSHYWSSTDADIYRIGYAWRFTMVNGRQGIGFKTSTTFAWAMQSGDVGEVPVPAAAWLFGTAMLGLFGIKRKK